MGRNKSTPEVFIRSYLEHIGREQIVKDTLCRQFFESGNKKAFRFYENGMETGVTYAHFICDVMAFGTWLYENGVRDKTVILSGRTSYSWIVGFTAVLCGSNMVVPVDRELDRESFVTITGHCGATLLICDGDMATIKDQNAAVLNLDRMQSYIREGKRMLQEGAGGYILDPVRPDSRALILYTSGTTGRSKGIVLHQDAIHFSVAGLCGLENEGDCLLTLPLFHIMAINEILLLRLYMGKCVFICRDLKEIFSALPMVKPESLMFVPAQAGFLLALIEGKTPEQKAAIVGERLKYLFVGGAPLSGNIQKALSDCGIRVMAGYGMTETAGDISGVIRINGEYYEKKGSVGKIRPFLKAKIETPDASGCGEIMISGKVLFDGYLNDPELTESVFMNGWFYTGDIGYIDEDGFLFIRGRKKNIILLSNGENVNPEELEEKLEQTEGVKECLVKACQDQLCACVYPDRNYWDKDISDEEIFRLLFENLRKSNAEMPSYKRIAKLQILKKPLKRTASGKVIRN